MGGLHMGLPERPPLEGEMRSGAAQDAAVGTLLHSEAGVWAGQIVRLELVEGGLYVGVPFFFGEAVAVEVRRHYELAEVGGLLDLGDQGAWAEGVEDPA